MQLRASSRLAEFGSASKATGVRERASSTALQFRGLLSVRPAGKGEQRPPLHPGLALMGHGSVHPQVGTNGDSNEEKRKKPGLRAWGRPLCPIPVTHYRCIPLGPAWAARVFSGPGSFLFFNITF